MKSIVNSFEVKVSASRAFYRIVLAFLLALVLFSSSLGSGLAPAQAYADPGTIAYVRTNVGGDEIRLIEPDRSNDRQLWKTNMPTVENLGQIYSLAWRSDASELAFDSRHEDACSMYSSDVYTIHSDGSGYRRVTAPPSCSNKAGLQTGTVNVYISNDTDSNGPFIVYFEGAPGPKSITLAPGYDTMVTFTNVADFGSFKQWGVVVFGLYRFFAVTGNADVIPDKTVDIGSYITMSYGYENWGWTSPTWKGDGSQISYIFNGQSPYSIPASSTAPGMIGGLLFNVAIGSYPSSQRFLSWAPPGPRANQLLYTGWDPDFNSYIYLGTAGSTSYGEKLVNIDPDGFGHYVLGLAWLPDSSGFLYSVTEGFGETANIYHYSFASGTSNRVTNFTSGYPRRMSVSPDGAHAVFEYQATGNWYDIDLSTDLYVMDQYGNSSLLVQNARAPAWSPVAIPGPVVLDQKVFVPAVRRP